MKSKRKARPKRSVRDGSSSGRFQSVPGAARRQGENSGGGSNRNAQSVNPVPRAKNLYPLGPYMSLNVDIRLVKHYNEAQLESLLFNKLHLVYIEAFQRITDFHNAPVAVQKAVLMNGNVFGPMSVQTNIVVNAIAYLNGNRRNADQQVFGSLDEVVKYSLGWLINTMRLARPDWENVVAMQHLVMGDLRTDPPASVTPQAIHFGNVNAIRNEDEGPSGVGQSSEDNDMSSVNEHDPTEGNYSSPALSEEDASPTAFSLTDTEVSLYYSVPLPKSFVKELEEASADPSATFEWVDWKDSVLLRFLVNCPDEITIDEWIERNPSDDVNILAFNVIKQIRGLRRDVRERREWAQRKVIEADHKVSRDLLELNSLRMEKEGNVKPPLLHKLDERTENKLVEMENAMRKANCQANLVSEAVKMLENKNSELKAEVGAFLLNASESDAALREALKREKKRLKKLRAMEKQVSELQKQLKGEKNKERQVQEEIIQIKQAQKQAEEKIWLQFAEKEKALALVLEEEKLKNQAVINLQKLEENLKKKIEFECQSVKDDMRRLEDELACLQISRKKSMLNVLVTENSQSKAIDGMLPGSSYLHDSVKEIPYSDRRCIVCREDEASVLFLPCCHQVMCAKCNEDHDASSASKCPCCKALIGQMITVY